MNFYETISILRQDTSNQGVKSLTDEFKNILTNMGAVVLKYENWGLLQLAYPIKRNKRGHYVALYVQATPEAMAELERNYKIKENVIRFMTLRVKKIDSGPSIMMQSKIGSQDVNPEKTPIVEKATAPVETNKVKTEE
jgi:small subunit ribosomal protein S6